MNIDVDLFLERIYSCMDPSQMPDEEELSETIDIILLNDDNYKNLTIIEKINLKKTALNRLNGLDIISDLMEDEEITEIMINGHENIFIEKNGKLTKVDYRFSSEQRLFEVIQRIMSNTNRVVNETSPIVDTRLSDGTRVNIVLEPIAINGSSITLRRFPKDTMTIDRLVEYGSINEEISIFLDKLVKAKYNIFISGGTSSGKTSMLNALSKLISKDERIITIEDSAELRLDNIENLVSLEVRNENLEGANAVTMRDLIKSALRMRPNRIIVGEVRGEETIEMLQAMNTGHSGSISTGHANSAKDMISRLETMVVMGVDIPLLAVRKQIASAIEIFIHLGKDCDGKRKLLEILEVIGYIDGEVKLNTIYKYDNGSINKVNELINREKYDRLQYV